MNSIPQLNANRLRFGTLRGSGTFSDVLEITYHSTSSRCLQSINENLIGKERLSEPPRRERSARRLNQINEKSSMLTNSTDVVTDPSSSSSSSSNSFNNSMTGKGHHPSQRPGLMRPKSTRRVSSDDVPTLQTKSASFRIKKLPSSSYSDRRLVAKVPRVECSNNSTYRKNVECLRNEAFILSLLNHEHIIKLHGVSSFQLNKCFSAAEHGSNFIILEELKATLDKQLIKFKFSQEQKGQDNFLDRLDILYDLACAMKYMHAQNVIHRDVKPANIGFDEKGVLKLFDFGLSTVLDEKLRYTWSGLYQLEGCLGSARYMAPEVANNKPYNEKVDVYSFAIVMWEVLSLRKPFKGLERDQWQKMINRGGRPDIDKMWPKSIQVLISDCWSKHIRYRPSFDEIVEILREQTCAWQ